MALTQLLEQKAALEAEIGRLQAQSKSEGLAQVRQLMQEHRLSVADVVGGEPGTRAGGAGKATGPVAAKYRDAATGKAWSGRGLKPNWLREALAGGRTLEEFAV